MAAAIGVVIMEFSGGSIQCRSYRIITKFYSDKAGALDPWITRKYFHNNRLSLQGLIGQIFDYTN